MTKKFTIAGLGAVLAVIAAIAAVLAFNGTSSAQEEPSASGESARAAADNSGLLAISIGALQEDGGESATVDLRASGRFNRPLGNFRFYSEEYGYYNGGVRNFNCDDGVITARGGGGLVQPDGTRVAVVYTATFDTSDGSASVTVKGKNGLEYTMEGVVDGLVWCGDPSVAPPGA